MKTAIILAAGKGTKIWPYNEYWPKAGLPIGELSNIEHLVHNLQKHSFQRIIIAANYQERRLKHLLSNVEGVEMISISSPSGTADTLEKIIGQIHDDRILVIYGDIYITKQKFKEVIDQFNNGESDACLLAKPINNERSQDWVCVKSDESGQVKQIYGHPRPHYVDHRLMGIYAFRRDILQKSLTANPGFMLNVNVGAMPPHEAELEQSIQWMVERGYKVNLYSIKEGIVDIDKPWHIMMANKTFLEFELANLTKSIVPSSASIHSSAEINGNVILGENVRIGRNVWIKGNAIIGDGTIIENGAIVGENVVVGTGSRLEDYCKIGAYSVIGKYNRFGHCAEFQGVTFDNVSFTHYGEVYGVIGTSTDIAAGVTVGILRFDDLHQMQKINGRIEMPEEFGNAVYFGDYTRTGISNQFMPGTKIGCNSAIGANLLIQQDIPSRTVTYSEQTIIQKEWGSEKYGW